MSLFILTFFLLVIVAAAMAVGMMVKNKTMASSCGGLGAMGIEKACDCDDPCDRRKERMAKEQVWKDNQIL
ncbi:Na(+)-translocating NADH-quinone reductase subunit E [Pseudoalteromonas sp. NBT06-2]|uniref:(Na+)-NQR maturation NqrM n=1 Tax=Pseudoalteromonas sp. NBT06-2 TaxID=2025950 RepID=UPI000BA66E9F|nr:(Na+)-NQR maturation NqrM [Pseudoalteromonas sp. NBT06-2]PAJ73196.1 Na(+)-translocating NADH-quinone reductase subunit E [Pseudoalteromonas sp. NBT06-2]